MQHSGSRCRALRRPPRDVDGMKEVSFTACNDAQTAQEVDGHGQFTVRALAILREGLTGTMTNQEFHRLVTEAFGEMTLMQTPGLDCSPASTSLLLFGGPLTRGSGATGGRGDLRARLDAIERRLSAAGL